MFRKWFGPKPSPAYEAVLPAQGKVDGSTLGAVLLKMKLLTPEQLQVALGAKAQHDELLLGSHLRSLGYVDEEQLAKALFIQAKIRQGDVGDAALDLMQLRLEQFGATESRISAAIKKSAKESKARGETTGFWLVPFSPGTTK